VAGTLISAQYGGAGGSLTLAGVLLEELGRGPLPGPFFSSSILASLIILAAGGEEQKKQLLPAISQGKNIFLRGACGKEYEGPRSRFK